MMEKQAIARSELPLPQIARGKVRDIYAVGEDLLLLVATDRLSAFDVVMGEPIPGKGELLTHENCAVDESLTITKLRRDLDRADERFLAANAA